MLATQVEEYSGYDLAGKDNSKEYNQFMDYVYDDCEKNLKSFFEWSWKVMEPGAPLEFNWHHEVTLGHLEALARRDIPNLIVQMPPRHTKSSMISVSFPVWLWFPMPSAQILSVSNTEDLALRFSGASRKLMWSNWYQNGWGDRIQFSKTTNTKSYYENNHNGSRTSLGVTSKIVGKNADCILIDDLHDVEDAEGSADIMRKDVDTFKNAIMARKNHPKKSFIIIINQRVHEDDVTGWVLNSKYAKDFEVLSFPSEYDSDYPCITSLGNQDPRTKEGELLWDVRFNQDYLDNLKDENSLGLYRFSAQQQQRPTPKEGGVVKITDFVDYEEPPNEEDIQYIAQFWDTAQKDETKHSFWVCGTWAVTKTKAYLIDVFRKNMDYPTGKGEVMNKYMDYQPSIVGIEDKSTGSSLIQELGNDLPIIAILPEGDKQTRMIVENSVIRSGKVCIPKIAKWRHDFLDEVSRFPGGAKDDQVDMLSMSLKYIKEIFQFSGPKVWIA